METAPDNPARRARSVWGCGACVYIYIYAYIYIYIPLIALGLESRGGKLQNESVLGRGDFNPRPPRLPRPSTYPLFRPIIKDPQLRAHTPN